MNFLKNFFVKKPKATDKLTSEFVFNESSEENTKKCNECVFGGHCKVRGLSPLCEEDLNIVFDKDKDSLLIIDDNEGMISFLMDDMQYFDDVDIIDKEDINILSFSGSLAAFSLKLKIEKEKGLNIKWAIIDITFGGSIMTRDGNVKYTGVDVYEMLVKYNPDVRFLFYTGNNLNYHIKSNEKLIEQFKKINGGNIADFVLFKTSLDMDSRRRHIAERLFL